MSDNRAGSRGVRRRTGGGGGKDGGGRQAVPAWLPLLLLFLLAAAAIVVFLVVRNATDDEDERGVDARSDQGTQPRPSTPATGTPSARNTLTAGGRSLLDEAAAGRLSGLSGQPVEGRGVAVQSVVADEGFWAGTDQSRRVFVFLTPQARSRPGESPFQVRAGQSVDFTGTLKAVPRDLTPFGVDESEGATQLRSQGQYVEATTVRLSSG